MKYFALIPIVYTFVTRLNTAREFLYVVATRWIPGVWLVSRLGHFDLPTAAGLYAIGYLAFMCVYEIGYLANDTWDASRRLAVVRGFLLPPAPGLWRYLSACALHSGSASRWRSGALTIRVICCSTPFSWWSLHYTTF